VIPEWDRVTPQALLVGFEELLAPAVVEARCDAFPEAKRSDALLAPQTFEYDPDLLFS